MSENAIRSLRRHVYVYDSGDTHWRGGIVWAIAGASATLRVQAEAHYVRDYVGATADLPTPVVGAPVAVRVAGGGADSYVIQQIVASHFESRVPSNMAAEVAAGRFFPGVVPRSITNEPETWWEAEP